MMSMKQWLALFTLLVLYLLLGATLYYYIESDLEAERREIEYNEGLELQGEFINKYG
jgi:peptidoglycan/LPS O-acetylase OafA/YrhL